MCSPGTLGPLVGREHADKSRAAGKRPGDGAGWWICVCSICTSGRLALDSHDNTAAGACRAVREAGKMHHASVNLKDRLYPEKTGAAVGPGVRAR
jgi:hypothetical protein